MEHLIEYSGNWEKAQIFEARMFDIGYNLYEIVDIKANSKTNATKIIKSGNKIINDLKQSESGLEKGACLHNNIAFAMSIIYLKFKETIECKIMSKDEIDEIREIHKKAIYHIHQAMQKVETDLQSVEYKDIAHAVIRNFHLVQNL
ncbi:hypothetical protein JXJ21_20850 [candidate division KSB1 bacterium]|nr:hypothetical protein [candidate division KSB1 bacterium]